MLQNHAQAQSQIYPHWSELLLKHEELPSAWEKWLVGISAPSPAYLSVQGYDDCNDLLNVKEERENRKGHEVFTILTIKTGRKKGNPSPFCH